MHIQIDRLLPVPVAIQLQGQIEYGMVNGDFPPGSRLPSVRELAAELGVSPVTVSDAYRELAQRGHIETVRGRGTFVRSTGTGASERGVVGGIDADVARLVARADRLGIGRGALVELVQRSVSSSDGRSRPLRIVFVGVYGHVTRTYAASLRGYLRRGDRIATTTFEGLREDPDEREKLRSSDLILTFAHRRQELERFVGDGTRVASVELVPARRTRVALAEIDPRARVALVSDLPEFLPTFRRGVARFASHVAAVAPLLLGSAGLREALADADVVVYGTGSESVLDDLPGSLHAFEYRHEPDPTHVEGHLLPILARLRASEGVRPEEAPTSAS